MTTMRDERLTADELHAMLWAWGVSVTPDSPLVGLPPATQRADQQALRSRGLLDEPCGQALKALQKPSGCFRTLIALPDRTVVQPYYAANGTGPGGLIGCWPEPPCMRIRFACTIDDLLRNSSSLLMADFPAMTDPLVAEFTPAGLAVLAAAVDTLRQRLLEAMLRRECDLSLTLSPVQLEQAYAQGCRSHDARWLVTLFRVLMPASVPLPAVLDPKGILELERAGLVKPDGVNSHATEHLCRLAAWWKTPLPALAHEVVALDGGRLRQYGYHIALRGDGPLWLLEFWRDDSGRPSIALRSRTGMGFRSALRKLCMLLGPVAPPGATIPVLAPATQPPRLQAPPGTAVQGAFCTKCGTPRGAGARFCTACGTALINPDTGGIASHG